MNNLHNSNLSGAFSDIQQKSTSNLTSKSKTQKFKYFKLFGIPIKYKNNIKPVLTVLKSNSKRKFNVMNENFIASPTVNDRFCFISLVEENGQSQENETYHVVLNEENIELNVVFDIFQGEQQYSGGFLTFTSSNLNDSKEKITNYLQNNIKNTIIEIRVTYHNQNSVLKIISNNSSILPRVSILFDQNFNMIEIDDVCFSHYESKQKIPSNYINNDNQNWVGYKVTIFNASPGEETQVDNELLKFGRLIKLTRIWKTVNNKYIGEAQFEDQESAIQASIYDSKRKYHFKIKRLMNSTNSSHETIYQNNNANNNNINENYLNEEANQNNECFENNNNEEQEESDTETLSQHNEEQTNDDNNDDKCYEGMNNEQLSNAINFAVESIVKQYDEQITTIKNHYESEFHKLQDQHQLQTKKLNNQNNKLLKIIEQNTESTKHYESQFQILLDKISQLEQQPNSKVQHSTKTNELTSSTNITTPELNNKINLMILNSIEKKVQQKLTFDKPILNNNNNNFNEDNNQHQIKLKNKTKKNININHVAKKMKNDTDDYDLIENNDNLKSFNINNKTNKNRKK